MLAPLTQRFARGPVAIAIQLGNVPDTKRLHATNAVAGH
ncbi:hypothetical protein MES4922_190248 [Mesorhizobium ventifaucium]|uniref:Uncharacterized protein n=1 Tax=Mesorhizobium ventifaucium TaxID=666020 RepID=A0ABN8JHI8_9HYPH|nr:hypothetical protein MES4922_190248 [Mesorhizobium ventifaucium]